MTLTRAIEGAEDGSVKVLTCWSTGDVALVYRDADGEVTSFISAAELAALRAALPKKFNKEKDHA